jgi:hypothetical protein
MEASRELRGGTSSTTLVRGHRLRGRLLLERRSHHERPIGNGFDSARGHRQARNAYELCRCGASNDASGRCCRSWNYRHYGLLLFTMRPDRGCLRASIHEVLADRGFRDVRQQKDAGPEGIWLKSQHAPMKR